MSTLSVFFDESGDFGPYEHHCPYYILTLVFHEQDNDISNQVAHLKKHIAEAGFPNSHAIHSAPLIRREKDYEHLDLTTRRKLFRSLFNFIRISKISFATFVYKKREYQDHDKLQARMSRDLGLFVRENLAYFQSFDKLIAYYDNGQKEVKSIINTVFNVFLDADVRKVSPSDYSLFQAADMFCTLALLEQKLSGEGLSNSEQEFFMSMRNLKKNYLKPASLKHL